MKIKPASYRYAYVLVVDSSDEGYSDTLNSYTFYTNLNRAKMGFAEYEDLNSEDWCDWEDDRIRIVDEDIAGIVSTKESVTGEDDCVFSILRIKMKI